MQPCDTDDAAKFALEKCDALHFRNHAGARLSYYSNKRSYLGVPIMILADNLPILRCPSCSDAMKLIRSVPRPDGLPDLLVVACQSCNEVEVREEKRVA
jgi:hypothetical protein